MKRLAIALMLLTAAPAWAADPSEMLKDPVLEKKAEDLGHELRCLVCQNESIEDSNADLARDLRVIVRERIAKGETPDQVKQYVVDRYGDYVLLKPPFKVTTLVLWLGPFALLLLGGFAAFAVFRRRGTAAGQPQAAPLSAEEKRRLDAMLKDNGQ
ncbi:cytochrome c-type biogenesis protein [Magnetospirillum sp. 64-120]|uniref:cytochrome c-type biogenesis protein n=1 Tax=Magnetospirillum sp. 64-120 TaxID=1895778 RepID=UPI00092A9292|nr:cytochrome c-type biogenesis protein [Magnetospirillum sp. 64-120]OJX81739.1 MAG: cytochrome C biogenesis protein CcmH [Magnetospirillum sp. 64-120]